MDAFGRFAASKVLTDSGSFKIDWTAAEAAEVRVVMRNTWTT